MAAARGFVRSCNVLLKQAALYGLQHKRCAAQLDTTWKELRHALSGGSRLAIAVAGEKLMVDGHPLACGTSERSLAVWLAAAGIGRLDFHPGLCSEEFTAVIDIFAHAKPADMLAKLKPELGKTIGNVRVHEFRVMDTLADPKEEGESVGHSGEFEGLDLAVVLSDPRKLLQLIGAAEASSPDAPAGMEPGASTGASFQEIDVLGVIRWLARFAGAEKAAPDDAAKVDTPSDLQRALQKILPPKPPRELRGALLLQLAEHVALRAVNDTYVREGLNVTAIQQMLERMNQEIESLRRVVRAREEELGRAGVPVETNAELLDIQFWKGIPDSAKRRVLLSSDAWVVPPNIIRAYVQPLLAARSELDLATTVLRNYCGLLDAEDQDARSKTAAGIGKLADLYSRIGSLSTAVHSAGELLARDPGKELEPALKESFVLLGQEALAVHDYRALEEWLYLLDDVARRDSALAAELRKQVEIDARVPEMVHTAIQETQPQEALIEVLKRVPDPTARYVIEQFGACTRREEGTRLARVLSVLGPISIDPMREMLLRGVAADAIAALGLLSVLEPDFLRQELPSRLAQWNRAQQDAALRQISAAGTEERGLLLLDVLDCLDPYVLPLAIDEIGMAGNVPPEKLIHLAQGSGLAHELPYLQVKAIEALGRLRPKSAVPLLAQLLTARTLLGWQQPRETRVVAAQSLQRIDPSAARQLIPNSGLHDRELIIGPADDVNPLWIRQRKYVRFRTDNGMVASLVSTSGASSVKVEAISLGGGMGSTVRDPQGITDTELDLYIGLRKLPTRVFIRRTRPHQVSFEFIDISLEDRSRLRGFVAEKTRAADHPSPVRS